MSVHCKNGIYSVHYVDLTGKSRQKTCGKGEAGKIAAIEFDKLVKAHKQALNENTLKIGITFSDFNFSFRIKRGPTINTKKDC